jgi:hypothetical protein
VRKNDVRVQVVQETAVHQQFLGEIVDDENPGTLSPESPRVLLGIIQHGVGSFPRQLRQVRKISASAKPPQLIRTDHPQLASPIEGNETHRLFLVRAILRAANDCGNV